MWKTTNPNPCFFLARSRCTAVGLCTCANRILSLADWIVNFLGTLQFCDGFSTIKSFAFKRTAYFQTHNYFDCSYNCYECNESIICESFRLGERGTHALWFISHTRCLIELHVRSLNSQVAGIELHWPFFHQMSISHKKCCTSHIHICALWQSKKESRVMCVVINGNEPIEQKNVHTNLF